MSLPDGEKVVWYKQPFRHNARVWQTDKHTESDTDINIKIHVRLTLNHRRRKLEKLERSLMRQYNKIFRQVSRRQRNVRSEMDGCSWVCTARHICGPPGQVAAAARHRVSRKRNDIARTTRNHSFLCTATRSLVCLLARGLQGNAPSTPPLPICLFTNVINSHHI